MRPSAISAVRSIVNAARTQNRAKERSAAVAEAKQRGACVQKGPLRCVLLRPRERSGVPPRLAMRLQKSCPAPPHEIVETAALRRRGIRKQRVSSCWNRLLVRCSTLKTFFDRARKRSRRAKREEAAWSTERGSANERRKKTFAMGGSGRGDSGWAESTAGRGAAATSSTSKRSEERRRTHPPVLYEMSSRASSSRASPSRDCTKRWTDWHKQQRSVNDSKGTRERQEEERARRADSISSSWVTRSRSFCLAGSVERAGAINAKPSSRAATKELAKERKAKRS